MAYDCMSKLLDLSTNVVRASRLMAEQKLIGELILEEEVAWDQSQPSSRVHNWARRRNDERVWAQATASLEPRL
jgi:hypothetical protein